MYHGFTELSKRLMRQGLEDDGLAWDFTSIGSGLGSRKISAKIIAKGPGIWAADPIVAAAELLSHEFGSPLKFQVGVKDGAQLKKGQTVLSLSGEAATLLAFERPLLNLASYLGGIAHQTRELVDQTEKAFRKNIGRAPAGITPPRVTSTRKTLPGYRDLAVYAVHCGGGHPHRVSLSGGVLIKENHIAAAGGIAKAIRGCRLVSPHGLKIEVEVRNLAELDQAIESHADAVLLDNFTPDLVKSAVKKIEKSGQKIIVEVSGGISLSNIGDYALPGVHVISSGSLTHSVKAIDLSLLVDD
ncbi:MAG: carboxylating nicotinate-nucleotide diphosphorylase [Bdellovibrionales bacterium]|nr:carboxylating nicotinate-nucleotide diphosphorylase [Bdellovibrionales bacterium]